MTRKCYRHGEIAFVAIDKLPEDLEKTNQKEFLKGSHGHTHSFDNGELFLKKEDEFIFGYFVAKNTKLYHKEHSPNGCELPDSLYQLRVQNEYINDELKQVID